MAGVCLREIVNTCFEVLQIVAGVCLREIVNTCFEVLQIVAGVCLREIVNTCFEVLHVIVRGVSVLLALCLGFARDCERCERITRLVFRFCT